MDGDDDTDLVRLALAVLQLQHAFRTRRSRRLAHLEAHLRDMARCVVCADECVRMVRCANGHGVCVGCQLNSVVLDQRCPVCREHRSATAVDASFESLARAARVAFRCQTCQASVLAGECEDHRAWCTHHHFTCPHPTCAHSCLAADMGAHWRQIHARHTHSVPGDGEYHVVAAFPPSTHEDLTAFVLGDDRETTVIVSLTQQVRRVPVSISSYAADVLVQLHLRAIYPSRDAPAVVCTMRQLRVPDCGGVPNAWVEEHRHGLVVPVVASREGLRETFYDGPVIKPRSTLLADDDVMKPLVCVGAPPTDPTVATRVRRYGLRDVGGAPAAAGNVRVALFHFTFRCVDETIGHAWSAVL